MFLPPWQSKENIQIKLINWFFSKPLHYRVTVTFHLFQHFLSIFSSFFFLLFLFWSNYRKWFVDDFLIFLAVQNDLHKMKVQTRVLVHLVVYLETRDEGANYYSHSFFFFSYFTCIQKFFKFILYSCYIVFLHFIFML